MEKFVYYSRPKLVVSLAPMFFIEVAFVWIGLKAGVMLIFAAIWGLFVVAIVHRLRPFNAPQFVIGTTEISFGRGLATKVPLSSVKHAVPGGPGVDAWPGSTSVLLEMESRVVAGQRYYDRKQVPLFCVELSAEEIAECINSKLHHDG